MSIYIEDEFSAMMEEDIETEKHSLTKNAVTKEHKPLKIEITEEDENHL